MAPPKDQPCSVGCVGPVVDSRANQTSPAEVMECTLRRHSVPVEPFVAGAMLRPSGQNVSPASQGSGRRPVSIPPVATRTRMSVVGAEVPVGESRRAGACSQLVCEVFDVPLSGVDG